MDRKGSSATEAVGGESPMTIGALGAPPWFGAGKLAGDVADDSAGNLGAMARTCDARTLTDFEAKNDPRPCGL